MNTGMSTAVIDSYRHRSRYARAEVARLRVPRLLPGLLEDTNHVAELPCGAGHFLADYLRVTARLTMVDGSPAMLAAAAAHACEIGLASSRLTTRSARIPRELDLPDDVDLVVVPNAALNQLASQARLDELWVSLRAAVRRGCAVLAQVACIQPDGRTDRCGVYDPDRVHERWFADRVLVHVPAEVAGGDTSDRAENAGVAVVRHRCQHRTGSALRIELDYRSVSGSLLHATSVDLRLLTVPELAAAAACTRPRCGCVTAPAPTSSPLAAGPCRPPSSRTASARSCPRTSSSQRAGSS